MKRTLIVLIVSGATAAGCGGSSGGGSSSSSAASTTNGPPAACATVLSGIAAIGGDAGALGRNIDDSAAQSKMVADADSLKTSLIELRGQISNPDQQAKIDQYTAALDSVKSAVQAGASGDVAGEASKLTGTAQEMGQLNPTILAACKE